MKYTREALVIASTSIGFLINGLLFQGGFWIDCNLVQKILIWIFASGILAYCTYRFLLAIARGGIDENKREA